MSAAQHRFVARREGVGRMAREAVVCVAKEWNKVGMARWKVPANAQAGSRLQPWAVPLRRASPSSKKRKV